jgi:autotransporter-associated beta strand protein
MTGTLQIGNGGTTGTLGTGSVSIVGTSTLAFNRSDALSITNAIGAGTGSSIAQNGTGTTTLSGSMGTYTGNVQVNRGTLVLGYGTNNTSKVGDSAVLTIGTAALQLAGGSHPEVVGSTTINGAASISRNSGTATLQLNTITIVPGAALNVGQASIATTDNLNVNNVLAGVTVNGTLAKNATNAADGNIVALAAGDYTQINRLGGTVADGSATNVKIVNGGSSGPATLASAVTTINTLTQAATDGPSTVDLQNNTLRLGPSGTILVPSGSGPMTFNNGTLTAGGTDNTAGAITVQHVANVTVNSTIADNGSGAVSLNKAGAGTLTLTANNFYTGTTAIGAGTLNVGNGGATGTLGAGNITNNGALVVNRTGSMNVASTISGTARSPSKAPAR